LKNISPDWQFSYVFSSIGCRCPSGFTSIHAKEMTSTFFGQYLF
jgi:hypothetical protein